MSNFLLLLIAFPGLKRLIFWAIVIIVCAGMWGVYHPQDAAPVQVDPPAAHYQHRT
jgi:hypothetical protein